MKQRLRHETKKSTILKTAKLKIEKLKQQSQNKLPNLLAFRSCRTLLTLQKKKKRKICQHNTYNTLKRKIHTKMGSQFSAAF